MPQRFGRYEVHDVIGAGGFATVYRATDPNLDATVAIKVLADNRSHDPEIRRRFRNEAVLLRRVQTEGHVRGIIEVFDIDETEDGRPFFVMGWADQGTLRERADGRSFSIADVEPVVDALAETLTALHEAGVVHRDLTPSNILLRTDRGTAAAPHSDLVPAGQRVVVGDLGLAKDLTDDSSTLSLVAGTQRYMAPEQIDPTVPVDARADIFAASTLVRDLLVGDAGEGQVPDGVREALLIGMAENPSDRYESIAAWHAALTASFMAARPAPPVFAAPDAAPDEAPGPARWRAVLPALLVGLALVALFAVFVLNSDDASPIAGPDEIVVGETVFYDPPEGASSVSWIDWSGSRVDTRRLEITPVLPGRLSFTLLADGEQIARSVTVVPSPVGPLISGPSSIRVGEAVLFAPSRVDGDAEVSWRDPRGERVDTPELRVQESEPGEIVIALIALGADGIERGTQIRVDVES